MAVQDLSNVQTYPAGADLSSYQHYIMTLDTNGRVNVAAGAGTPLVGVLLNKPAATGRAAEIAGPGCIAKVIAGGAINEGDWITSDSAGKATATTTAGDEVLGFAKTAASASGDLFEVVVSPHSYGA
jgi:hypothetical protein